MDTIKVQVEVPRETVVNLLEEEVEKKTPKKISALAKYLVEDILERYFHPDYFDPEHVENFLLDYDDKH
jgi:hypothetical protein